MLYGLRTVDDGIIFKSRYLAEVLKEMEKYPSAYIVEIEEKIVKRNYSEEFVE